VLKQARNMNENRYLHIIVEHKINLRYKDKLLSPKDFILLPYSEDETK
jgi:hypothetical protein